MFNKSVSPYLNNFLKFDKKVLGDILIRFYFWTLMRNWWGRGRWLVEYQKLITTRGFSVNIEIFYVYRSGMRTTKIKSIFRSDPYGGSVKPKSRFGGFVLFIKLFHSVYKKTKGSCILSIQITNLIWNQMIHILS